jgi:hypothetical protein
MVVGWRVPSGASDPARDDLLDEPLAIGLADAVWAWRAVGAAFDPASQCKPSAVRNEFRGPSDEGVVGAGMHPNVDAHGEAPFEQGAKYTMPKALSHANASGEQVFHRRLSGFPMICFGSSSAAGHDRQASLDAAPRIQARAARTASETSETRPAGPQPSRKPAVILKLRRGRAKPGSIR